MALDNGMTEDETFSEIKREVLEDLRDFLVSNIDPSKFFPYLRSKRVLTEDDEEEIESEKTRKKRAEKFLNFICKRGGEGFDEFCEAIRRNKTQLFMLTKILDQFESRKENLPLPGSDGDRQLPPLPSNPPAYDDINSESVAFSSGEGLQMLNDSFDTQRQSVPPQYN